MTPPMSTSPLKFMSIYVQNISPGYSIDTSNSACLKLNYLPPIKTCFSFCIPSLSQKPINQLSFLHPLTPTKLHQFFLAWAHTVSHLRSLVPSDPVWPFLVSSPPIHSLCCCWLYHYKSTLIWNFPVFPSTALECLKDVLIMAYRPLHNPASAFPNSLLISSALDSGNIMLLVVPQTPHSVS